MYFVLPTLWLATIRIQKIIHTRPQSATDSFIQYRFYCISEIHTIFLRYTYVVTNIFPMIALHRFFNIVSDALRDIVWWSQCRLSNSDLYTHTLQDWKLIQVFLFLLKNTVWGTSQCWFPTGSHRVWLRGRVCAALASSSALKMTARPLLV